MIRGKLVETEELPAYCAVMMAGLNDLPDTIMSRCVVVRMKKRAPSEEIRPWRLRIDGPLGLELGKRLADWADSARSKAKDYWPQMPDGVDDRDADTWEALLAVADLAGGHWPQTGRVAAVAAVADSVGKAPSLGVMLLRDIRITFSNRDAVALDTYELLTDLQGIEESPWLSFNRDGSGITARQVAKRRSAYGIESCNIRHEDGKVLKGYYRAAFSDAWDRYLSPDDQGGKGCAGGQGGDSGPSSGKPATSATSATPQVSDLFSVADSEDTSATAATASASGDPSRNGQTDREAATTASSRRQRVLPPRRRLPRPQGPPNPTPRW